MLPCNKRQKIVKRKEGVTSFRCMNTHCELHRKLVDESDCDSCEVRSFEHVRKCKQKQPQGRVEFSEPVASEEEILQLMEEAGLDASEFDEATSPEYPSLPIQMWLYKEAIKRWIAAGRPTRSKEEVEHIHTTFCKRCDWYDKEKQRCRECGCKVNLGSVAILNKLKMATEHCPQGLF